ncbi:beta-1,3-glucanase family protein [Terriglobus saanensis]|uniref:Coagulation factor 5/8 type domain protein n=1 Tax=Terriglobus saanensis (strain ATCC BAA-1853 / DSM 23119 / SP1PR4) TaxID=401053 RepID=E8UYT8_TERSS|nr:beta-1,3-glucanase family protein [Terriglobus saanensis]ADV84304.1 coagulation factor 5/8 type domain protein [Terriglobus saanensis SP1PR4]
MKQYKICKWLSTCLGLSVLLSSSCALIAQKSQVAPTGPNLALGKPAKSSGDENASLGPAKAVDGNLATRWSSAFADDEWIEVDLGSVQTINQVALNWQNSHAVQYNIQVSTDEAKWTDALVQTAGLGGVETPTFPPVSGRFVRMLGIKRSTIYGYSLFEFGVYGPAATAGPTITAQPASQTVTAGVTVTFTVAATGTGALSYQWLKNGVPISGANSASYVTPVLAIADSGTSYSVTVTDAIGSVASNPAILTVNPGYTVYPGFVGTDLANNTKGAWPDDQIYVTVIGLDPQTGVFATVKPDGTITDVSVADNDAAGHLTKNKNNYPNYAFTLAQSKLLKLPKMSSGRVFISMGEPVYLKILQDAKGNIGYAGPNPQNTTDPNENVPFDWYEFTYNNTGLFINTTQVDEFGLPLVLDVWGNKATFHQQTGITESIAALDQEFVNETPAEFHTTPISNLRILSPTKTTFGAKGVNGQYFDAYVANIWNMYSANPLIVNLFGNRRFTGTTTATSFNFTEVNLNNGAFVGNSYVVNRPTTQDIFQCSGSMAKGDPTKDINTVELALEAQMCAAFNRHVMADVTTWATPSAFYLNSPTNSYAQFWHRHSMGGLAYGFAYDDVSGQSSTISTGTPEHMVFTIGW